MKRVVTLVLAVSTLLGVGSAVAAHNVSNRKITQINVYGNQAILTFSGAGDNSDRCSIASSPNRGVIPFDGTKGQEYLFSMAQALYISQSNRVGLRLQGCHKVNSNGTLPVIVRVTGD